MESGDFGLEKIELSLYLNKNPESQIRNRITASLQYSMTETLENLWQT